MLLFSESFLLQAPLAIPNRVSPRNKQGPLPFCTLYGIIQYDTVPRTARYVDFKRNLYFNSIGSKEST